jgi:hypothetical protein
LSLQREYSILLGKNFKAQSNHHTALNLTEIFGPAMACQSRAG